MTKKLIKIIKFLKQLFKRIYKYYEISNIINKLLGIIFYLITVSKYKQYIKLKINTKQQSNNITI